MKHSAKIKPAKHVMIPSPVQFTVSNFSLKIFHKDYTVPLKCTQQPKPNTASVKNVIAFL